MSRIVRGPQGIDICPLCLYEAGICYIGQGDQINVVHRLADGTTEHSVREDTPEQVFADLAAFLASNPVACAHNDRDEDWEMRLSERWMDWNARVNNLPPAPSGGNDPYAKARARGLRMMGWIKTALDKYGEGLV